MANQVKISQLSALTTPESSDLLAIVDNSTTKKITLANIFANISSQVLLQTQSLTSGTGVLLSTESSYDAAVPNNDTLSLLYVGHHNTSTTGGLFQGIRVVTNSDLIDTAAGISISNVGRSDGLYISLAGKSGSTASAPTGVNIDLNRSGVSENSTANTGSGIQVLDWSSTDTGLGTPTAIHLKKQNNPDTHHDLLKLTANRNAIELVTPAGGGYDATAPLILLSSKFMLTAGGALQDVSFGMFGKGAMDLTTQVANGSIGVINTDNTTTAYLQTVSGFAQIVARRSDFSTVARGLKIVTKTSQQQTALFDDLGNVVVGTAALATSATDGFFYIATCAGIPIGTPTSQTGTVPMIYDTSNNNFYIYNGGWKKTSTFA